MNRLGLDMALHTGWAVHLPEEDQILHGSFDYTPYNADWGGLFAVHQDKISDLIALYQIDRVILERNFHRGTASPLFAGLNAIAHMVAFMHVCERREIAPNSLKKIVTGNGHASKEAMIVAIKRATLIDPPSDDEADAIALLLADMSDEERREYDVEIDR